MDNNISMTNLFDLTINKKTEKNFLKNVEKLLIDKDFVLGQDVIHLENKISQFLNTKYSVGVNSGTDALELSLKAAGIKKNDRVIVPGFSFFATSESVLKLGAKPVFCDISISDLCINIESILDNLDEKIKAIIPVHLFGNAANIIKIKKFQKNYDFCIIEDVAQAFGSTLDGKKLGSMGEFGCFSFYPTKNLGGFGDGGLITTNIKKNEKILKILRNHGQTSTYIHERVGYNSRLDTIQAKILIEKLKNIDILLEKRIRNNNLYINNFQNSEKIKIHAQPNQPLNLFPISFVDLNLNKKAKNALLKNSIQFGRYYPKGLNELPLGIKPSSFLPNVSWATQNILTIPVGPNVKISDINKISEILLKI